MQAVVSNASMWDTLRLLPQEAQPPGMQSTAENTPMTPSFMHLHLGFDATGVLPIARTVALCMIWYIHNEGRAQPGTTNGTYIVSVFTGML